MSTPLPPDDNLGPAVLESIWIEVAITAVFLAARFYTRARILGKVGADDWAMLFSYLVAIVGTVLYTVSVSYGTGRHEPYLSPENSAEAFKWNLVGQVIGILSSTFARVAFCMMLFGILSVQQHAYKWILWSIVVSQLLLNVSLVIFILTQCQPLSTLWDHSPQGHCLAPENQEHFGFVQGSVNSATDLALAILPATIIWKLNMKLAVKLSLCVTLGLGICAMAASIMKTIYLKSIAEVNDYSYETCFLLIWFSLEQYVIIVAASIPTLRPLLTRGQRGGGYHTKEMEYYKHGTDNRSHSSGHWGGHENSSGPDSDQIELTTSFAMSVHQQPAPSSEKSATLEPFAHAVAAEAGFRPL